MTSFDVVTFGEPMTLFLAAGDVPLISADNFEVEVAGAESNLATGLARLGHRVSFFGRVGADTFGMRIRNELRAEGIDVGQLVDDPELPTGLLIRDNPSGRPITVEYRRSGTAAAAMSPESLPTAMITDTRLLHVTGITAALSESSLAATERAMIIAAEAGVTVSLDPNIRLRLADPDRWQVIIKQLAQHAKIIFTGRDEAEVISPGVDPVTWYGDHGAEIVIVKDGGNGSSEHQLGTGRTVHGGVRPVPLVDPIGAGDGFNAGWISSWLDGAGELTEADAERRLLTAATVASMVVSARGDRTGLPTRAMLDQVLASGADVIR
ncbi:sugar kinase [Microlunatus soli]|uniref:2-dehydro-3-deoxygluconokinase n=1 Tax=Microlunatus soli TaxID=630515 RepID=A0A1H1N0W0_9ACTN|nr:sugar kinase [Microlunatus soli]SDR92557.1 2-dehydro-3-deoxygluconokinase [Microlunatus soli]